MTYRDLKAALDKLDDRQLDHNVVVTAERVTAVGELFILEEDYIDPSGDGMEPKSVYAADPEYADETVVARKGDVFLVAGDYAV